MQPEISVVLLAGGEGKRLWPISNKEKPKQFIILPNMAKSTFQLSLLRAVEICTLDKIIITTHAKYLNIVQEQSSALNIDIGNLQILCEEMNLNTGRAIYDVCEYLLKSNKNDLTYFFPTDQIISALDESFIDIAMKVEESKINILGQHTSSLCNKFGYIIQGDVIAENYFQVKCFVEKPNTLQMKELENHINKLYCNLGIYLAKPSVLKKAYSNVVIEPLLSIDKLITERSANINCIAVNIEWLDIGSMENFYEYYKINDFASLNCKIDRKDIECFNEQHSEFQLECEDNKLHIIRKNAIT